MSEVGIKKYIGVTLAISLGLSAIKFFKYDINYELSEFNFPISNEWDIININLAFVTSTLFNTVYFILTFISDIMNYFLLFIVCCVIDVWMVIKLKKTLNEKFDKLSSICKNMKQLEFQKKENKKASNKAVRMVVINTFIGLMFKLPVCILPLFNLLAQFMASDHPLFSNFYFLCIYNMLLVSGLFEVTLDLSDFLYTFSISIVLLIYNRFDKKFKTGYDRLIKRTKK